MKSPIFLIAAAAAAVVVSAHAEPIADRERAAAMQAQADQQRRIERAAEKCRANRGTDCDTLQGLQEWLLQDRSRADAVLDRVYPAVPGSASAGSSSSPISPSTPQISPKNP